ncbi:protocadherin Fat 4-like [Physella acuta]|uniref:protocadherin Fat 4-like n=1 Tax=Physella acuta TaxID=109671 RepID=UPI0027DB5CB0|nr:protocadherin Fat 4-like [Physella acuta]
MSCKNFTLQIIPLANQAPAFTSPSYTIYVSEGVLNNSRLFDLPVSDPDTALNQLVFTSTELTTDKYVYMSGLSLFNVKQFDREVIPQHTVTVRVADPQGNTATATLIIIVQDINDNSPAFGQNQYTFSIQENQPVATIVGSVSATDADEPNTPNSALTYGIVQTLDFDKFTINPSSGQLASNAIFDYETKQQYQIVVRVSDNGNAPRTTVVPVTVNILDLQDNPPLFQVLNIEESVNENVANILVATIKADDADSVKSYNFVLADNEGSTDSSAFSVQTVNNEARVYVNSALNYEVKNRYTFQVTTQGMTGNILYTTASVTVNVLDLNDNPPVIGQYTATITVLETVAIGSALSNLTATDADGTSPNNRIEYKVQSVSPNSGSNLFYVGEKSAILTVASSLQADRTVNTYTITVIAFDLGTPSLTATGTVTVTVKRNTAPVFQGSSTTLPAVNENIAISTSIFRITATDIDTNITPEFAGVTYSLAADSVASSLFQINPNTGDITLTGSLYNRADSQYTIQIIATDLGGLSARVNVIVPVNRNLFVPEFDYSSYIVTINENFPLGNTIVQIAALDSDINSPWKDLSFTITGDALGLQYCAVSDTGIIFLRRTLALTNITELNLMVSLKDKGNPPRTAATTATVKIYVTKNSQSPIFFNETYRVTIPENQAVSSSIITVLATDADPVFNKLTYYIEGDQSAAANFAIDPNTGVITLIRDLRQSSLSSFVIRVAALDDGAYPRRGTALVFVDVTRNLQSPRWIAGNPTTATVYENAASGTSVVRVSASDTDSQAPNNVIDYIITSGGEYFQVDQSTGLISVKVPVYLDTAANYQVTLIARDRGTPTRQSAPFTVTITSQRNRFAPKWQATPFNFYLTLPLTNNQLLRTLSATDDDLPPFNQLTFELLPYSSSSLLFTSEVSNQNSINIRVSNANLINSDTLLQYFFYAKVRDIGSPSLSDIALVTFNVNRNLNAPSFLTTTKEITINETLTPGSFVIDCPATDADGFVSNNGVVTYSDGLSFTTSNYFRVVERDSGIILQRPLQQDTATTYTVIIRAQDNGKPPLSAPNTCTVTIRVIRNLNPPVFVNTPYETTIARTATAGLKVVQVTATDADLQVVIY